MQASGVHDSRHDTLREEDEERAEGRDNMYQSRIEKSHGSRGQSTQIYCDERYDG